MNTEYLRNFIAIVETGSITAAAQKQSMSQPNLSSQLKLLEESTGNQLVIRNAHTLQLTEAGRLLYEKAQKMIRVEDSIFTGLYDLNNGLNGTLHLGVTHSFTQVPIDDVVVKFLTSFPSVKLNLYEGDSDMLIDWLNTGVIDVAILFHSGNLPNSLQRIYLYKESLCVAYPKDNEWDLPKKEFFSFSDLKDIPLCMTRGLRETLAYNLPNVLKQLNCKYLTASRVTTLYCVKNHLGIGLLPASGTEIHSNANMIYKPVENIPFSLERCCLIRAGERYSAILENFLEFVRSAVSHGE